MKSKNLVILVGNVGNDPETKNLESGKKVTKFSLATNKVFKDKNDKKQKNTQWHILTCWGNLADIAEKFVKKGMPVMIEGELNYSNYEDKDGVKRYSCEIIVNDLILCGSKQDDQD